MFIDTLTLMIPSSIALVLGGIFLVGAWYWTGRTGGLLWWGVGHILNGIGLAVLAYGIANDAYILLLPASIAMGAAPALIWVGARRFDRRPAPLAIASAGLAFWLFVFVAQPFGVNGTSFTMFMLWSIYLAAAAWQIWVGRKDERLMARTPLVGLLLLHAFTYGLGSYDILIGAFVSGRPPLLDTLFGVIHFETLLYVMGTTAFMSLLCRERVERIQIETANVDPLTGAANRRAFTDIAERILRRSTEGKTSVALIVFDLDRFKTINDTYGHKAGDRVLRTFVDMTRGQLRANDLFGRFGGEEFVALLPDASMDEAAAIAERIRVTFGGAYHLVDGQSVNTSVSAGVATLPPAATLDQLLVAADAALYRAKGNGRNNVQRAIVAPPPEAREAPARTKTTDAA